MPLPLTHYASQALLYAEGQCAPGELTRESDHWLLLGVLGCVNSRAFHLLTCFSIPVPDLAGPSNNSDDTGSAGRISPPHRAGTQRILALAEEEALLRGRERVGPEHLLFALARSGGSASRLLSEHGADYARLTQVWEYLREHHQEPDQDYQAEDELPFRAPLVRARTPGIVGVVAAGMLLQSLCGGASLATGWLPLPPDAGFRDALTYALMFAGPLWTTVGGLALVIPFLRQRRWAWAGVQGTLFIRCALALASMLWTLTQFSGGWEMSLALVLTQSVRVAPLALLTVLLFRCRGWFGVKHGRAWSTMLREGWWALLITLVAEGGIALYSALLLRGSS